jgi:hypothetical protein
MKLIYILLFALFPIISNSQTANISGVVTYFFNSNIGDKPDVGAKVFIIDSLTNPEFQYSVIDSFIHANAYRKLYFDYLEMYNNYNNMAKTYEGKTKYKAQYDDYKAKSDDAKKNADNYFAKMLDYKIETAEKFTVLDKRATTAIIKIDEDKTLQKTVDGIGNYSVNVKPGTYYILIVSKSRTGKSITEVSGQIFLKKTIFKENESKTVSKNFILM